MTSRKVVLYISMSLDGFIATKDDDLSWLEVVQKDGLDYGYQKMIQRSDTYLVGRHTYDVVKKLTGGKFPQADMFDCYVLTRQDRKNEKGVTFYNGNIQELIQKLKAKKGKDIYCDGGGQVVKLLLDKNLIDEFIISIIPIILGNGKRLFHENIPNCQLELLNSQHFDTGLVQLHYRRKE